MADVVGRLIEFWGFKRAMGRMWGILYLTPEPLSAAELGSYLKMSAGAVSMALAELQKWGVVRKSWRPGERRDYYEAEVSIWKMVSRVFRERELQMIRAATEEFDAAAEALLRLRTGVGAEEKRRIKFVVDRIRRLTGFARLGAALLGAVLAGEPVDPAPLRDFRETLQE